MLIDLDTSLRANLIEINDFYLAQSKKKLLSQFESISDEADQYEMQWQVENKDHYSNRDPEDSSLFYNAAYEASINYYQNLSDLHENVRFSIIAGMFHRWEKQFRSFLHNESRWWRCIDQVRQDIWSLPVNKLFILFKNDDFDIEDQDFFKDFDACRVLVNVYKHGNGSSFKELCKKYPEFLNENYQGIENHALPYFIYEPKFNVRNEDVIKFSEAISEFWRKIPNVKNFENAEDKEEWLKRTFEKKKRKSEK